MFLAKNKFRQMQNLSETSEQAPSDYLFPQLKIHLMGKIWE